LLLLVMSKNSEVCARTIENQDQITSPKHRA